MGKNKIIRISIRNNQSEPEWPTIMRHELPVEHTEVEDKMEDFKEQKVWQLARQRLDYARHHLILSYLRRFCTIWDH